MKTLKLLSILALLISAQAFAGLGASEKLDNCVHGDQSNISVEDKNQLEQFASGVEGSSDEQSSDGGDATAA